jgi:hypothetical protein
VLPRIQRAGTTKEFKLFGNARFAAPPMHPIALVAACHLEYAAAFHGPSQRCLRDGPHSGLRRGLARGMTLETPSCQDGFKTSATALGVNRSDSILATRMIGNMRCAVGLSIEPPSDMRDGSSRHLSCIVHNLVLFSRHIRWYYSSSGRCLISATCPNDRSHQRRRQTST